MRGKPTSQKAIEQCRTFQARTVEIRKQRKAAGLCVFCGGPHPKTAQRRLELQGKIAKLQAKLKALGGAVPPGAPAPLPFHGLDEDRPIGEAVIRRTRQ